MSEMYYGAWLKSCYMSISYQSDHPPFLSITISITYKIVLVSVQADSKRAKNFKNRDRDRINRPNFGGRTLARLFWRANFWPV
ncbi:hypothetical protein BpHYR1_028080 [Brachionus plicatilis]|uniref:Uncharacterized protein n=1 Tax=Brachionus plicatilis TaxID=10195 RepID=A0A3M7QMV3_BRAPC|nr:hypothetical protein BpHYR1_028080 [Brachionus plicatilis]